MFDRAIPYASSSLIARDSLFEHQRRECGQAVRTEVPHPSLAQLLDAADRAKSLAAESVFRHNAVECGEAMSQRLPADPTPPSPIPADPSPCTALNREAIGIQPMSSDAGADDQQTARRPEVRSDERRIPIAHQARPRKGRTSGQKVLADIDVGARCANRKDDPFKLVVGSADHKAAVAPKIDDARNRPLQIRRWIAWTSLRLGEHCSLDVDELSSAAGAATVHAEVEFAFPSLDHAQKSASSSAPDGPRVWRTDSGMSSRVRMLFIAVRINAPMMVPQYPPRPARRSRFHRCPQRASSKV